MTEPTAREQARVIFGEDDRQDVYAFSDPSWAASIAEFSVALMSSWQIDDSDPSNVAFLDPKTGGAPRTHGEAENLCPDQRFVDQQVLAFCSGTLIAPDLVLTAAHCMGDGAQLDCDGTSFVFNFYHESENTRARVSVDDIYSCQRIEVHNFDEDADYAIVRLDRPATDRAPAAVSFAPNSLDPGRRLIVSGHPTGLPTKIADDAWVTASYFEGDPQYFDANLDGFRGNSGSGVFTEDTKELVGVLTRGPALEYVPTDAGCNIPFATRSADPFTPQSMYAFRAVQQLCSTVGHPTLCHCGNGTCEPGLREDTKSCLVDCGQGCGDGVCNGTEDEQSCYEDCGVCGNNNCEPYESAHGSCCRDCGCAAGSRCEENSCELLLGNVNGDGAVDELDAVAVEARAAGGNPSPFYPEVADVSCDGVIDKDDSLLVAQHAYDIIRRFPCEQVIDVAGGHTHNCVAFGSGKVRCVGDNYDGQLGLGHWQSTGPDDEAVSTDYVEVGGKVRQISAAGQMTCAVLEGGAVRCWGPNREGELGYANREWIGDDEPAGAGGDLDIGGPVKQVAVGGFYMSLPVGLYSRARACALLESGAVRCWGYNESGELGYGHRDFVGDDEPPSAAGDVSLGEPATKIVAGGSHFCALLESGNVRCWGENGAGQLGYGNSQDVGDDEVPSALPVVPIGAPVNDIAAGRDYTCVALVDGGLKCWGNGPLGYGDALSGSIGDQPDEVPSLLPRVQVGGPVASIETGDLHACAKLASGGVRCWGNGIWGYLGYGNEQSISTPAAVGDVPVGAPVKKLKVMRLNTCAILESGDIRCWGYNYHHQLGFGWGEGYARFGSTPDTIPAVAGDVPVIDPRSEAWELVNPYNLEVWVTDRGSSAQSTAVAMYVANRGTQPVTGMIGSYLFSNIEAPNKLVGLQDSYTPWSTPSIRSVAGFLHLRQVRFDFGTRTLQPGQVTSWGQGGGEAVRIHFTDWSATWDKRNDYSAADIPPSGQWSLTDQIRLYDSNGALIYGWRRR